MVILTWCGPEQLVNNQLCEELVKHLPNGFRLAWQRWATRYVRPSDVGLMRESCAGDKRLGWDQPPITHCTASYVRRSFRDDADVHPINFMGNSDVGTPGMRAAPSPDSFQARTTNAGLLPGMYRSMRTSRCAFLCVMQAYAKEYL